METKYLFWGTGKVCKQVIEGINFLSQYVKMKFEVVAFADNSAEKHGKLFDGKPIIHPSEMSNFEYDEIIICCDSYQTIESQLIYGYSINKNKIHDRYYLLKKIMEEKYQNDNSEEIRETLEWWKSHDITYYNQFLNLEKFGYNNVEWDKENNLPFILFETSLGKKKKMYFPRDYRFKILNDKFVIRDLWANQYYSSPHAYVRENHDVKKGDIILDAGVCEGNFSLRYIDIVKKAYMVECDPIWEEPLYYTFKEYKDRIKMFSKQLSDRDGSTEITIDTLTDGHPLDFVKMDIEGAEIRAILGGKKTFTDNNIRCSICSYHKYQDEERIRELLQTYGYKTWTSKGYLVFMWDEDIFYHADFRRGVVYGSK